MKPPPPPPASPPLRSQREAMNPRTGKVERVFVNLEAVYASADGQEFSFEELRARHRGWLDRTWQRETLPPTKASPDTTEESTSQLTSESVPSDLTNGAIDSQQDATVDVGADATLADITTSKPGAKTAKGSRSRRKRVMEVKGETQTGTHAPIMLLTSTDKPQSKSTCNRPPVPRSDGKVASSPP